MPKKITPVLYAEEIEPCIAFWVDKFGFTKTAEVPEGDRLGFVMLQKGNLELMYQSYASAAKDVPALAHLHKKGPSFLFVEVEDLAKAIAAAKEMRPAIERRTTFYGSQEYGIFDPAGHLILFAQFG